MEHTTVALGGTPREVWFDRTKTRQEHDGEHSVTALACRCNCCNACWLFAEGNKRGSCIHGGPYLGYLELRE